MRSMLAIAAKDLRQQTRDRSAYIFAIIAPFGLALVLSGVFGPAFDGDLRLSYAVVDEDDGPLASVLVEDVLGPSAEAGAIEVERTDHRTAMAMTEEGEAGAAIVVPAGFSSAVLAGEGAQLEVITDRGSPLAGDVANAIASAFATELSAIQVSVATAITGGSEEATDALAARAAEIADPLPLEEVATSARVLDPATYFSAGIAVFFLFFTVQFGVIGLLEERRKGTMARMLAGPLPPGHLIGGKATSTFLLGVLSMVVLIVATTVTLDANWGDPLGVFTLVVVTVIAALAIMALVATFARTVEQANTYGGIIAVVLGMLGGSFFPVAQGPGLIADASRLTPHAWFLRGLENMADGSGVESVVGAAGAILAFAAVFLAVAGLRVRRMVTP